MRNSKYTIELYEFDLWEYETYNTKHQYYGTEVGEGTFTRFATKDDWTKLRPRGYFYNKLVQGTIYPKILWWIYINFTNICNWSNHEDSCTERVELRHGTIRGYIIVEGDISGITNIYLNGEEVLRKKDNQLV